MLHHKNLLSVVLSRVLAG